MAGFDDIPPEIRTMIAGKLGTRDLIRFGRTCKTNYDVYDDESVWRSVYATHFFRIEKPTDVGYRSACIDETRIPTIGSVEGVKSFLSDCCDYYSSASFTGRLNGAAGISWPKEQIVQEYGSVIEEIFSKSLASNPRRSDKKPSVVNGRIVVAENWYMRLHDFIDAVLLPFERKVSYLPYCLLNFSKNDPKISERISKYFNVSFYNFVSYVCVNRQPKAVPRRTDKITCEDGKLERMTYVYPYNCSIDELDV